MRKGFRITLVIRLLGLLTLSAVTGASVWASPHQRILVDQAGRSVAVPVAPERVVALAPNITEIVYALGCQDRLQGVTTYSNYPEPAAHLPKVGSYLYPDIEKILSLQPDLCIAVKDGNPKAAVERLETLGISVYAVNPRGIDSVIDAMIDIGGLLNASASAQKLAQELRSRIARVEKRVALAACRPRVFFQIGVSPIVSVGANTYAGELIARAGGVNIARDQSAYPRFSIEEVLIRSPEIIIISSMERGEAFERVKAEWKQWPQIPAVKQGRIHLVDSDLFDRPSPRLADSLELLARLIHPELFND
jgi:iron complex transport system substrate-binding protein